MFQSDITKLESTLEQAILECLSNDERHTDQDGCTLGGLIMELQDNYPEDVSQCVLSLIAKRRAYVAAPLELADLDTYVFPVTWTPGASNRTEVEEEFGQPHAVEGGDGKKTITFDLYVVDSDDPDLASVSVPYAVREAASDDRPQDCSFPYTHILPSEALQVQFKFDDNDILVDFDFKVGLRLT